MVLTKTSGSDYATAWQLPTVYNVRAYGTVGDGVVDDTAAIQAALDAAMTSSRAGGTIYFPPGTYKITSTLRLYRGDGGQHYVNVQGAGANSTSLVWAGSTSSVCMLARNSWNTFICDLSFTDSRHPAAGSRGTTIGLQITAPPSTGGTGSSGTTLRNVGVSWFNHGFQIGGGPNGTEAASEVVFTNCSASQCDTGFVVTPYNSLDVVFIDFMANYCTIGVDTNGGGGSVHFQGGSCSYNGIDFNLVSPSNYVLDGLRSEGCTTRFLDLYGGTNYSGVTLTGCYCITDRTSVPVVIRTGWGSALTVIGSQLSGGISFLQGFGPGYGYSQLTLINNAIGDTVPFRNGGGGSGGWARYFCIGNTGYTTGGAGDPPLADESGWIDASGNRQAMWSISGTTAANAALSIRNATVVGTLTLAADPATGLQAATKQYVDGRPTGVTLPLTQNLLFSPDNAYDIGASGANRPHNLYLANDIQCGGWVNGAVMNASAWITAPQVYSPGGQPLVLTPQNNVLEQRNGTNAQTLRIYGTYTDASNYSRLSINGGTGYITAEAAGTGSKPNIGLYSGGTIYLNTGSMQWGLVEGIGLIAWTDNAYDIGQSGSTRPRDLYMGRSIYAAGAISAGPATAAGWGDLSCNRGSNQGAVFFGGGSNYLFYDGSKYQVSGGGIVFSTDNAYDIGASGANRPRSLYVGTSVVAPAGTAAASSYSFAGTPGTGINSWTTNQLGFSTNGVIRWAIQSSGHIQAGSGFEDNTYDIGVASARPRNLLLGNNLTINGSVQPNATNGATAQPVIFHPSQNYGLRMWDSVVLAQNNTAAAIPGLTNPMGMLMVANLTTGGGALFWLYGGANNVYMLASTGGFSITFNNAGTVNVYWDGAKYAIQNTNAASYTLRSFFFQHI